MSRGLILGVLIGAGGASAFWRMKMQALPPNSSAPVPSQSPSGKARVAKSAAEPTPARAVDPVQPVSSTTQSKSEAVSAGRTEPEVTGAVPSPSSRSVTSTPTSEASPSPAQSTRAKKNEALVDKFMTKLVIPKLHDKIKHLFQVDEGLKKVRKAEQTKKPQLFVELGESCFAQLVVGLQAFCLLKLLIAVKVNYATRQGKPKAANKKAGMDAVKKDIVAAIDKFLKDGLSSLVVRCWTLPCPPHRHAQAKSRKPAVSSHYLTRVCGARRTRGRRRRSAWRAFPSRARCVDAAAFSRFMFCMRAIAPHRTPSP
jgi:hypothetical protein